MSRPTQPPRRSPHPQRGLAVVLVAGLSIHPGCATRPAPAPTAAASPAARTLADFGPSLASIQHKADRQARSPSSSRDWPPPPGLDPALAQPVLHADAASRHAAEPLDAVVDRLVADAAAAAPPHAPAPPPSEADRLEALRAYAAGREKFLSSGGSAAVDDLRRATRLDPDAPEPWRALGEVYLQMGARDEAVRSFQEALARGPGDARVLETLGRAAAERGDTQAAASYLARALRADAVDDEPGLVQIICVQLSRALVAQGSVAAAREALVRAIDQPARSASASRYQQELAAILRRRAELWRDAGDAALLLGRYDEALASYVNAASLPSLDGVPLGPRTVYAAVKAGRPAEAALGVYARIVDSGGRVVPADLAMIRYLAPTGLGRELAGAADEVRTALVASGAATPTLESGLRRAQAAALDPREARPVLIAGLAQDPSNHALASDALAIEPDAPAAARAAASLAQASPFDADLYARCLADRPETPAAIIAAAETLARKDAGALVAAGVARRLGDPARAVELAASVPISADAGPAAASACATLNASLGRWDQARAASESLRSVPGPQGARARALALAAIRSPSEALAELRKASDVPGETPGAARAVQDFVLEAELAIAAGRAGEAETALRRAAELDRAEPRTYALLLDLFNYDGLTPDAAKATQAVRDARLNAPDAPALRWVRAQEIVRRNLLSQAERELTAIAEDDREDARAIDLLAWVWEHLATQDAAGVRARALAWVDEQSARRPNEPALIVARARVIAASGNSAQAADDLRAALARAWSEPASRALERILRESLDSAEEADALVVARLGAAPRTPGASLELAEVLLRRGDPAGAADAAAGALAPDAAITPEQSRRLTALGAGLAARAIGSHDPSLAASAARLLDGGVARGVRLPREVHDARIRLLSMAEPPDQGAILAAATLASAEFPDDAPAFFSRPVAEFLARGRMDLLLAYMPEAADRMTPLPLDFQVAWFQAVGESGHPQDARRLVARVDALGDSVALIQAVWKGSPQAGPPPKPRAQIVYLLASFATETGRPEEAAAYCELALELDPGHVWAANDLGYFLADKGEQLERAEGLIGMAYAAVPGNASISDSLGWVRYKRGALRDAPAPEPGGKPVPGALSLLRAAASTAEGRTNYTILDHYGDALWLAGNREEALRCWQSADAALAELLAKVGDRISEPLFRPLTGEQKAIRLKLEAARAGGAVEVAAHGPVAPAPAPAPGEPSDGPPPSPANNAGASEQPAER